MDGNDAKRLKERLKKRRQRETLKNDPSKLEKYRLQDKERKCQERKFRKRYLKYNPIVHEKVKERKRIEMRAYRAKKKGEKIQYDVIET